MTLRRRLVLLHSAFAAFAVGAALATIYAVQLQIEKAAERFETLVDQLHHVEGLRGDLKVLDVHLHEIVAGTRPLDAAFEQQCRACLTRLAAAARFSTERTSRRPGATGDVPELHLALETALTLFVDRNRRGDRIGARDLFKTRIEGDLLPALDVALQRTRNRLDDSRQRASSRLLERDTQLLLLAVLIAVSGVGIVVAGALVVRRRLVKPIASLQMATEAFAEGKLDFRVNPGASDELGNLGLALNNMAAALQTSQRKYQTLFENLRDTVIVCDADGTVQECHEGDGALLGIPPRDAVGQCADDVWPQWRFAGRTWRELVTRVLSDGERLTISDLPLEVTPHRTARVDVVAYGVEYAGSRYAAVVIRDVTERHGLQRLVQRSETMEAAVTFARGIAHDFKNLLHSALATLAVIEESTQEAHTGERVRTVLEACRQAARLSRRLSRFAASDEGNPERLCLAETVRIIVDSLGETLFDRVRLEMDCVAPLPVRIDRDQLTQIVLNLVYNACEAMPDGGTLRIKTSVEYAADPLAGGLRSAHAVLSVCDTGTGMSEEAIDRAFEPLYSTKPRSDHGPRGMGLAVVYAAVNNAGGFIRAHSELGVGTTFRIYLPSAELTDSDSSRRGPGEAGSDELPPA